MMNSYAKGMVTFAVAVLLLLVSCSTSSAAQYVDIDFFNKTLDASAPDASGRSAGGIFEIGLGQESEDTDGFNAFGYVPPNPLAETVEEITFARVAFGFAFGDAAPEEVEILLSTSTGFFGGEVTAQFIFGTLTGNPLMGNVLLDLSEDGRLTYSVTALQGDVTFRTARLDVTTVLNSRPVPDAGSWFILIGIAAIGLGLFKRRFAV